MAKRKVASRRTKAKLDAYGRRKVEAQKRLPIGKRVVYRGMVAWAKGKPGVIVKHEKSAGGVFVKIGERTLLCSPLNFVEPKPAA